MGLKFEWIEQIDPSLIEAAEEKLRMDIEDSSNFNPCHEGTILVSIISSDPLEVSIKGNIKCECGEVIATFKGASDGSKVNYCFQK